MNNILRRAAAISFLSAAGFIASIGYENLTTKAIIPTQGDVATIAGGATRYEDGTKVKLGDTVTPQRAVVLTYNLMSEGCQTINKTIPDALISQTEYDLSCDFIHQYGSVAWVNSTIPGALKAGDYKRACEGFLSYRYMTSDKNLGTGWVAYQKNGKTRYKFDCAVKGNKVCYGVWIRQQDRYSKCMEAQA